MKGITKRFPGVLANDSIDLTLNRGEIHALLGENGAGKTTLMNILYGLYKADAGEIFIKGKQVSIRTPKDAIALKIAMVHQHFELVLTLTVAENVGLGLKAEREPILDLGRVVKRINELSAAYGLLVDPSAKVEQLSVGERQRVEIIKALYRDAEILILDEPTSVLTPKEIGDLFKFLRSMAEQKRAIVMITHKLQEVMENSDRVTVLRHGKVVARLETKLTSENELAEKMVGRELPAQAKSSGTPAEELLVVDNVFVMNDKGVLGLNGVSLSLRAGEILGIAGVAGNGQTELAEVLTGMRKLTKGKVMVQGRDLTGASPSDLIAAGLGNIPEDRLGTGIIPGFCIAENLVLEVRSKQPFAQRQLINDKEIHANAERLVEQYSIACSRVDAPAWTLSGGNLQKLVLAKVLSRTPKILIAASPTSGLDVGAAEFISDKLKEQRTNGVGVLLISEDLNEIFSLSDRIAVIYEGKIMGIVSADKANIEEIGLMMGGVATK
jgi:simple sugar transport system ATP-binding protein